MMLTLRRNPIFLAMTDVSGVLVAGVTGVCGAIAAYFVFRGQRDPAQSNERTEKLRSDRAWMEQLQHRIDKLEKDVDTERNERSIERSAFQKRIDELQTENTSLIEKVARLEGAQINADTLRTAVTAAEQRAADWEKKWNAARDRIHDDAYTLGLLQDRKATYETMIVAMQLELNKIDEANQQPARFETPMVPAIPPEKLWPSERKAAGEKSADDHDLKPC